MMKNIFVDPSKSKIACKITPLSLHVIGFEIQVIDSDQNTILENYTGKTSSGAVTVSLTHPPAYYKGKYISGTFTLISPDGSDYDYNMKFSILTDYIEISPYITISGKTSGGQDTIISTFNVS